MTNPNLVAALRLAANGIYLFPCQQDKKPLPNLAWRNHGVATIDAKKIDAWWQRYPDAMPAFELGKAGLIAIDCDRHGGPDGVELFDALAQSNGDDPRDWPCVQTPTSGRHIFFRNPKKLGNRKGNLPAGIDVRGAGGYVIAEGSTLNDGRKYATPNGLSGLIDAIEANAIPELPQWIEKLILAEKNKPIEPTASRQVILDNSPPANIGPRERANFETALNDEARLVATAGEGGRNNQLNTSAFNLATMVASGWGNRGEVEFALTNAAQSAGLDPVETRKTIASGIAAGIQSPRAALIDRHLAPMVQVNLSRSETGELIDTATGEIIEDAELETLPIDERLTYCDGILGEVIEFIVGSSRRPNRRLALAAALPLIGTIIGRCMATPTGAGTHLYVIATAPTGAGKQHQLDAIDRLMRSANLARHLGPSEYMSMSSLVRHVEASKLSISAMDEFGAVLSKISHPRASSHEQGISKVLRSLWGASFANVKTPAYAGASSVDIACPALSLFGPTTEEELYKSLTGVDLVNGFLNRFLVIDSGNHRPSEIEPELSLRSIPQTLSKRLIDLYQMGTPTGGNISFVDKNTAPDPSPVCIPWHDQSAHDCYKSFSETCQNRMFDEPEIAPFLGRTAEMALRCATILACGCSPVPSLKLEHMEWGCQLAAQSADKLIASAGAHMTEALGAAEFQKRLISLLKKSPNRTMTLRQISQKMSKHQRNSYDLVAVIKSLKEMDVVKDAPPTSYTGRPTRGIVLI